MIRPDNGSVTSYQYNGLNQLTEILNKTSTNDVLNQHVFTYNNWDLRSSETITGSALPAMPSLPEETRDYAYNTVNQLLSVTNPNLTFVYDDDGNMIQGYTPDGYVFTADYDAEDRMTSLEYTDSSSVVHRTEYRYRGDGFLAVIRKFENSSLIDEIRIVRDGFLAIQDRDENNTVLREYTWGLNLGGGIGGLLNMKQGGQDYAYLYDGKGNVAAVLDSSQAVVAAYRYAPFGKLLAKTGTLDQPYGFSTKRYDEQTGLIHYQYRSYAPAIGRWTTRDPLGEAGGMNLYAFVGNNPVNWVDPLGLEFDILPGQEELFNRHLARLTRKSATAAELIEILRGPEITVVLEIGPSNEYDRVSDTVTYTGQEGVILMNKLEDPKSTKLPKPWEVIPPEIALIHELIHAYHDVVQGLDRSASVEQDATVGFDRTFLWWGNDFSNDRFTENKIRSEYGIPARKRVSRAEEVGRRNPFVGGAAK